MKVILIDYGSGNLKSAAKALERAGRETGKNFNVVVSKKAAELKNASHIVLPGVGSFGDCKKGLESIPGLTEEISRQVVEIGKPFSGICVGMQLLAEKGLEYGEHRGLNLIPGLVRPINLKGKKLKIPHMGWNTVKIAQPHFIFRGFQDNPYFYFVHSYNFVSSKKKHLIATADYSEEITSVVSKDNIVGTQFHPEKSQKNGIKFIYNFLSWTP